MFTHLHGHSRFSLLDAIGSSKAIISRLKELGFSHAPLTDYNGLYNAITHYEICKKEGMNAILGVDLAIHLQMQGKSVARSRFITLLAKNYTGYLTLLEIISRAQTESNQGAPVLQLSSFPDTQDNIIALISAYESQVGDLIEAGNTTTEIIKSLEPIKEIFHAKNVFLEIIPQDPLKNKNISDANMELRKVHEETGMGIIVSSNFHYIHKDDKDAYDIARCIKDGKRIYDDDRRKTFGDFHIMSEAEIKEACTKNGFSESQIMGMLETTGHIGEQISIEIPLHKILFPVYQSPEEIKNLYTDFCNKKEEKREL